MKCFCQCPTVLRGAGGGGSCRPLLVTGVTRRMAPLTHCPAGHCAYERMTVQGPSSPAEAPLPRISNLSLGRVQGAPAWNPSGLQEFLQNSRTGPHGSCYTPSITSSA